MKPFVTCLETCCQGFGALWSWCNAVLEVYLVDVFVPARLSRMFRRAMAEQRLVRHSRVHVAFVQACTN